MDTIGYTQKPSTDEQSKYGEGQGQNKFKSHHCPLDVQCLSTKEQFFDMR